MSIGNQIIGEMVFILDDTCFLVCHNSNVPEFTFYLFKKVATIIISRILMMGIYLEGRVIPESVFAVSV